MSYEDCVGAGNCERYQSVQDTNSCRRCYGCNQKPDYDIPYRGE